MTDSTMTVMERSITMSSHLLHPKVMVYAAVPKRSAKASQAGKILIMRRSQDTKPRKHGVTTETMTVMPKSTKDFPPRATPAPQVRGSAKDRDRSRANPTSLA